MREACFGKLFMESYKYSENKTDFKKIITGRICELSYLICFLSDIIASGTRAPWGKKKGVEDDVICETIMM